MNDIFSNLVVRNSGLPSPEVLQPRLPTLFDPAGFVENQTDTFADRSLSYSKTASGSTETGQTFPQASDRDSSSQEKAQDATGTISTRFINQPNQPIEEHASHPEGDEPVIRMTILQPPQPQPTESIQPPYNKVSRDELQDNLHRSETVMSQADRTPARYSQIDPHWEAVIAGERVVHPRVGSLSVNTVVGNNPSVRPAQGNGGASKNIVLPHEELEGGEAPVVRIHIGRIDVRAVAPAPAQQASKPAPVQPRLTLEDYLRQREGHR